MTVIFVDNKRKYKFMVGYKVKVGSRFYEIMGIEPLRHKEATGSVATVTATTKDWDTYMRPLNGYIYFVEKMGINGYLGFAFQFPKGIVHGAPRGETEYIYFNEANSLNPLYYPFVIIDPYFPTWALYNPNANSNNSDAYFFGERWLVREMLSDEYRLLKRNEYTELVDYSKGGIGQG